MRPKLLGVLLTGLMASLAAGSRAATLDFSASLGLSIAGLSPVTLPGSGVATVNGSQGGFSISSLEIPAGAVAGTASLVITGANPISGVLLAGAVRDVAVHFPLGPRMSQSTVINYITGSVSNGPGAFSGAPLNGSMPLNGIAIVCLFAPCNGSPAANLIVPLSPVGQGGTAQATGLVSITVVGAPWTAGMASIGGSAVTGFAHGPASEAETAAQPSGVVSLVTPVLVSTSLSAFPVVPVFGTFVLHFVPEPGTFFLLGSGLMALALVGGRRARR